MGPPSYTPPPLHPRTSLSPKKYLPLLVWIVPVCLSKAGLSVSPQHGPGTQSILPILAS